MSELADLSTAIDNLAAEIAATDDVGTDLAMRVAQTRRAVTERRNTAQSRAELDEANALLVRLRDAYAP